MCRTIKWLSGVLLFVILTAVALHFPSGIKYCVHILEKLNDYNNGKQDFYFQMA